MDGVVDRFETRLNPKAKKKWPQRVALHNTPTSLQNNRLAALGRPNVLSGRSVHALSELS